MRIFLALPLLACACQQDDPSRGTNAMITPDRAQQAPAPAPAATAPAGDRLIAQDSDLIEFSYGWPAEAAAIGPLNQWLEAKAVEVRDSWSAKAGAFREEMESAGFPFHRYQHQTRWTVAADTARLLVLVAETYHYRGGAHGDTDFDSLIWDRETGRRIALEGLVTDRARALAELTPLYCRALEAERAKRRGAATANMQGPFDDCPPLADQTIVPGAAVISPDATPAEEASDLIERGRIDRLSVLLEPYEAGPYAEGSYRLETPVTRELLTLVDPRYRSAFTVREAQPQ